MPENRTSNSEKSQADEFARAAANGNDSLIRELWELVRASGKWWLLPILLALLVIGLIVFLGSTAAAPFIYQLF